VIAQLGPRGADTARNASGERYWTQRRLAEDQFGTQPWPGTNWRLPEGGVEPQPAANSAAISKKSKQSFDMG
jgi:hypothetical protein